MLGLDKFISTFIWEAHRALQGSTTAIVFYVIFFVSFSELHGPHIHRSHQPASLQCHQFQCCCGRRRPGGQQLQQLPDLSQQPGPGVQHRHQADLRPHEPNPQVQPPGLLAVPRCREAHLSGRSQPAGELNSPPPPCARCVSEQLLSLDKVLASLQLLVPMSSKQNYVEEKLIPTWNWMVSIMDSTEAQLRYGSALSSAGDPGHPSHPLHASQHSARRERINAREEASIRSLEGRRWYNALALLSNQAVCIFLGMVTLTVCILIHKRRKLLLNPLSQSACVPGEQPPYWQLAKAWCLHGVTFWTTPCPWCAPTMTSTPMFFPCWTCARSNT